MGTRFNTFDDTHVHVLIKPIAHTKHIHETNQFGPVNMDDSIPTRCVSVRTRLLLWRVSAWRTLMSLSALKRHNLHYRYFVGTKHGTVCTYRVENNWLVTAVQAEHHIWHWNWIKKVRNGFARGVCSFVMHRDFSGLTPTGCKMFC